MDTHAPVLTGWGALLCLGQRASALISCLRSAATAEPW